MMANNKKEKSGKEIVAKYQFSDLEKLSKEEIIVKFKRLYSQALEVADIADLKEEEVMELKSLIEHYKKIIDDKPKYLEYDPEWGGIEKVEYILKVNERIMTSNKIAKALLEIEPLLKLEWKYTLPPVVRYISRAVKAKKVMKYYSGNGFAYGLPNWFDEDGSIKRKFFA